MSLYSHTIRAVIGLVANLSNLATYADPSVDQTTILTNVLRILMAWGWCTFAVNTLLSVTIVARIL